MLMSPPSIAEDGLTDLSMVASSVSTNSTCYSCHELRERNYMGLSDCSSAESCVASSTPQEKELMLNLKQTELRLGLPGSQSPERSSDFCLLAYEDHDEKHLFPLTPTQRNIASGNKRFFSDVVNAPYEKNFPSSQEVKVGHSSRPAGKTDMNATSTKDKCGHSKSLHQESNASSRDGNVPAAKAQVVGWPPIRSFRKNTLALSSKNTKEVDSKSVLGALFVKVSMDGAPYLRKVDLRALSTYSELSSALEKMFSCFTIGSYGSHSTPGNVFLSENKLKDLLHGSEYVLTYEDRDGDWMLVGDVPWEMFIGLCKRLRIMKSVDAIGLAPKAYEKSQR